MICKENRNVFKNKIKNIVNYVILYIYSIKVPLNSILVRKQSSF